jgi:hypothetical protein
LFTGKKNLIKERKCNPIGFQAIKNNRLAEN